MRCSVSTSNMMIVVAVLSHVLQATVATTSSAIALAGCPTSCGNISIPYPFGIGLDCFLEGFEVVCNNTKNPRLFFTDGITQVLNISLQEGTVRVKSRILTAPSIEEGETTIGPTIGIITNNSRFSLSTKRNLVVAFGCDLIAQAINMGGQITLGACVSLCGLTMATPSRVNSSCTGFQCCQTSISIAPFSGSVYLQIRGVSQNYELVQRNSALLVESDWFTENMEMLQKMLNPFSKPPTWSKSVAVPLVLDWTIGYLLPSCPNASNFGCLSKNSKCYEFFEVIINGTEGYKCSCQHGFEGNPYMLDGCQDIDECAHPDVYPCYGKCINKEGTYECLCPTRTGWHSTVGRCPLSSRPLSGLIVIIGVSTGFGLLMLFLGALLLIRQFRVRRSRKLKRKFFKRNQGLLLQQLISSNNDIAERMKIFSLDEVEKATNRFDPTRIVGRGGHGIVYKGILSDQRVVAIKKASMIIQREIDQFINEVAILSQIDHRNVVKLYGCCLESEAPLLVYEFISNGTLFDRLHLEGYNGLPWADRLRIALETARALAHLHSAASISVFHRDIKSANILLDDYLTVKVSDFGASRLIPIDQTSGINTVIQGTHGYLDPEYHYTGRLTEKSDVFSFGVILAELLTREKPTSITKFEMGENLAAYFCSAMRRNCVNEILDPLIAEEKHRVEIDAVASLAETCLRLKGDERPTMKQVETRLEVLNGSKKRHLHPWAEERSDEKENILSDQSTRQYSLENELMLSSHYPR